MAEHDWQEKRDELDAKQKKMNAIFDAAGPRNDFSNRDVLEMLGAKDSTDAVEKMEAFHRELADLAGTVKDLRFKQIKRENEEMGRVMRAPVDIGGYVLPADTGARTFGDMVIATKSFKAWTNRKDVVTVSLPDLDLKTLMTTAAGFAPESVRSGLVVPAAGARVTFLDILPVRQISQAVDKYMEQTTRTDNSAEKGEGVAYAESEFVYTQQESPIRKITNSLPVTDEQLEDAPEVVPILNSDVVRGLRERLELQALVGDGNAPNIEGFLDAGKASVQTQAKGADPVFDAVFKGLNLVRTTGDANPTHIAMHPTNWLAVRLARTADGQYIMGNPIVAGPETLFGLPVVLTTRITSGTALVGDFLGYSYIANRRGVDIQIGYSGTQFAEGERLIRADLRAGLTVTRQAAFCKITGLA